MPPKKKGRTTRAKPKIVELTPEEQQSRDQCDLLLKDFDKHCEVTVNEARREVETVAASINTLYKLELLKIPQDVKNMKWDDYYQQALAKGQNPLALSDAISNCLEDSICATVDTQVSQLKSAIKTTAKKRGRKKVSTENQQPATVTRTSSRSRATSRVLSDSSNLETPANSRSTRGTAKNTSSMATPANNRPPPNMGKTPMITPKFDTSTLARTVSRVARSNEVLVSLSGSPVVPNLNPKSKAARAQESQAALIPLGGGETLNIPLGGTQEMDTAHLDDDQLARLEELQKSLTNMLKMRRQVESSGGEEG
eukprot:GFUD01042794.1.p1 GENE.GFUD01042794.1~~GFUD01042794.1.p1  ORF type:complete len:311 (+),score=90.22 GFUD01042794.1:101-1033(+)